MVAALILSAGLGTRLAPISSWRAKPLVPIGDRPAIAHIVERLHGLADPAVVNAHYRVEDVEAYARSAGLAVSRELELLGTAGGLRNAASLLGGGDVLVWNGDMIGELDVRGSSMLTRATRPLAPSPRSWCGHAATSSATRGSTSRKASSAYGVTPAAAGRRTRLTSSVFMSWATRSCRTLPSKGDIIADAFLPAIREGGRIAAFPCDAAFIDVGTPRSYLEANVRWLASGGRRVWIGDGAHVDGEVTLDRVVLGRARAFSAVGGSRDRRWPGAEAYAPLTGAVVAVEGEVDVLGPAHAGGRRRPRFSQS